MSKKLDGKIGVITGGSAGIGLATAKRFVAEGAYVFVTGRRQAELDAAVTEIGSNVIGVQGDVASLADLDRLYETIKVEKGRIDVLFANAGVYEAGTLGEISEGHFDMIFNVNVRGLLFSVQKALPLIVDGGSIILNGSVSNRRASHPSPSIMRPRRLSAPSPATGSLISRPARSALMCSAPA